MKLFARLTGSVSLVLAFGLVGCSASSAQVEENAQSDTGDESVFEAESSDADTKVDEMNADEAALRQFLNAMIDADRESLVEVSLSHENLQILLTTDDSMTAEQFAEAKRFVTESPIRRLEVGEIFILPGDRPITMDTRMVNESRQQLVLAGMAFPMTVIQIEGRWYVDPGALIAAREAAQAFRERQ